MQLLLWAAGQPERLSPSARKLLNNANNELLFSAASLWEITIKNSLGREDFRVEPRLLRRGLLDNGYTELPITSQHAVSVDTLPLLHKDPFRSLARGAGAVRGCHAPDRRYAGGPLSGSGAQDLRWRLGSDPYGASFSLALNRTHGSAGVSLQRASNSVHIGIPQEMWHHLWVAQRCGPCATNERSGRARWR